MVEDGETLYPVEIKSGQTINGSMFDGLNYWRQLSGCKDGMLCYGGNDSCDRNGFRIRAWNAI